MAERLIDENRKQYGVSKSDAEAGFSNETVLNQGDDGLMYPDEPDEFQARRAGGFLKRGATTQWDQDDEK